MDSVDTSCFVVQWVSQEDLSILVDSELMVSVCGLRNIVPETTSKHCEIRNICALQFTHSCKKSEDMHCLNFRQLL